MTARTQTGCMKHDSILRCSPNEVSDWPTCIGNIPELAKGQIWNRDSQGWRGTPSRRDKA